MLLYNRSQMTSKCGKNKEVVQELLGITYIVHILTSSIFLNSLTMAYTYLQYLWHFDIFYGLLLNRCMATWKLLVLYNYKETKKMIVNNFNCASVLQ